MPETDTELQRTEREFSSSVESMMDRVGQKSSEVLGKKTVLLQVKCYDVFGKDFKAVDRCLQDSTNNLSKFHSMFSDKLNSLQSSLQSCAKLCDSNDSESCLSKCLKDHSSRIGQIESQAHDFIAQLDSRWAS